MQRRKGAKTQGFGFLGTFVRWVSDSSPSFPSHLPALCAFALTAFLGLSGWGECPMMSALLKNLMGVGGDTASDKVGDKDSNLKL